MSFEELGLSEPICKAVNDVGYSTPTAIQKDAIPLVLMGRDLLATAQTGTGKTAAFTLPLIDILAGGRTRARMPRCLILEPTRELAAQVEENFNLYGKYNKLSCALIMGGESMDEQIRKLDQGVDVLIATPGRLLDLFERGRVLLNDIKILVIDEADRMLDMGFIPDIEKIGKIIPPIRQTLMFSATLPAEIQRLASQFLMNPKRVEVAATSSASVNVEQHLLLVDEMNKRELLRHLLRTQNVKNAFIFCNRKKDIGVLERSLNRHGFNAAALHGDMAQSARSATFEAFKADRINLLVCSDVAARGLDVDDVSHVFNFDIPFHAEDYVHRIGRTGRAGKQGSSYTFAMGDEGQLIAAIETMLNKPIPRLDVEGLTLTAEEAAAAAEGARGRGRGRGGRSAPAGGRGSRPERGPRPERKNDSPERNSDRPERAPRAEQVATPTAAEAPVAEAAAPVAAPAQAEARPERAPRQERSERGPRNNDRNSDRPSRNDRGPRSEQRRPRGDRHEPCNDDPLPDVAVGFGDQLPAFLAKQINKAS